LAALYVADPTRAEQLADGVDLDVFEAAALGKHQRLVELLASHPELAAARTHDGFTALHLTAFFAGDPESAGLLLAHGAQPGAVADNPTRVTPLNSAAARGHVAIVRLLLDHGAEVDATQAGGYTALHSAALHGAVELVEVLLHAGADPACAAEDGRAPAALAREGGQQRVLDRLATAIERSDRW